MHVYIYDDFLNKKKFHNILNNIEIKLTDLGLNGKIIRLGAIKNVRQIINNEIQGGNKTLVAVGNDFTVNKIINSINFNDLNANTRLTLAIIPVERENNNIAKNIGIHHEIEACNLILARRIKKIDLIKANDFYFINSAHIDSLGSMVDIENKYEITCSTRGQVHILNLPAFENVASNPQDEKVEILIDSTPSSFLKKKKEGLSFFSSDNILIKNKDKKLILDDSIEIPTPIKIKTSGQQLNIIVGKERNF